MFSANLMPLKDQGHQYLTNSMNGVDEEDQKKTEELFAESNEWFEQ
jgi:hypothetical protein